MIKKPPFTLHTIAPPYITYPYITDYVYKFYYIISFWYELVSKI